MSGTDVPLRVAFTSALKSFESLDEGCTGGDHAVYQAKLKELIGKLLRLNARVGAQLFSSNETADDVSTADLKYALIGALIGDLFSRVSTSAAADRLAAFEVAERQLLGFLGLVDRLLLLSVEEMEMLRVLENPVIENGDPLPPRPPPTNQTREAKIAQFRREKELKEQLSSLREQLTRAGSSADDDDDIDWEGADDERAREYVTALIQSFVIRSMNHITMMRMERPLLRMRVAAEESGEASRPRPDQDQPPPRGGLKTIHLPDKRALLQAAVFQPGHNLPTMSVEQWAEIEMAKGNFISGGGAAGEEVARRKKEEAHYTEKERDVDEATMKARESDEHNDDNRRGSGNTYNRS